MSVVTKNPFAYLGNDSDGEEKTPVPVKTVDKAVPRTTKRNVEPQAPVKAAGTGGGRRGPGGSEGAFRDRNVGSSRNQGRSTEETPKDGPRGGYGARVQGGRGGRRPRERDDRHTSKAGVHGATDKQVAQGWGATEGQAELKDEQAGEAIAKDEQKDAATEDAAPEEPAEPEDKHVSYADYLVQQAERKGALDSGIKVREANEGSKLDKKWAGAKTLEKEEEDFITGTYGKAKRERERKQKQTVDFDPRFVEPERTGGGRGGRGGQRGGQRGGRGGDRGRGGERGRGGAQRGGAPRGGNAPQQQRGNRENAAPINTKDESAFPSLGGK